MFIMDGLDKREDSQSFSIFFSEFYWPFFRVLVVASDPDNHDGVITHLGPDILEYEVKWALGSITTNKGTVDEGMQLSYFKS